MKSGQYITEIVKRLYNSQGLKKAFPDSEKRIRHIFKHQVYGLAPTECIYRISLRYILGFDDTIHIDEADHHLRQADSLPAAKAGTMEEFLDEVFWKKHLSWNLRRLACECNWQSLSQYKPLIPNVIGDMLKGTETII